MPVQDDGIIYIALDAFPESESETESSSISPPHHNESAIYFCFLLCLFLLTHSGRPATVNYIRRSSGPARSPLSILLQINTAFCISRSLWNLLLCPSLYILSNATISIASSSSSLVQVLVVVGSDCPGHRRVCIKKQGEQGWGHLWWGWVALWLVVGFFKYL